MRDLARKVLVAEGPAIFFTGQAGFIIKSKGGQLLAIDLYLSNCVERVEGSRGYKRLLPQILNPNELDFSIVICTHPHLDHFDIDAVPELMHSGKTKLFCSVDCEKLIHQMQMEYYSESITYVKPGDRCISGDFDITFVNCDHGAGAPDAIGVVVKVDGKIIYEAGDTCRRLDRVDEIPKPDVMIAPINGMYGNLDEADCAALAAALKPGFTVPCHYGMFASHHGDVGKFYDIMTEKELPFLLMQQGEQYTF